MQLDDTPLQPGRSYLCQSDDAPQRRVKIQRIKLRQGRWFAIGIDPDRRQVLTLWIDETRPPIPFNVG